ncbi:MAG: PD-(D/E)XK nuclease family transposase [Roseburia sp.]|nr:PD-(D/E)XK nuclease family transposase [Roseburia sp.]
MVNYKKVAKEAGGKVAVSNAEEKRKKIQKRIKDFRLFDDEFMTKIFEDDIECTELLLHIIMDKPDLKVKKTQVQYVIKNLQGRSLTLDIHATDNEQREYDIEIQRADSGAKPKRARYHSSLLDANVLLTSDETEALPETYVIFITENDVLGKNKPIYHINRYIEETGEVFGDSSHILYVNGAYRDETPIGLLMRDFSCMSASDMHYKKLADRVRYFKENEEGVQTMSGIVAELIDEEKREMTVRLLKNGKLSKKEIAEISELDIEVVETLEKEQKSVIF